MYLQGRGDAGWRWYRVAHAKGSVVDIDTGEGRGVRPGRMRAGQRSSMVVAVWDGDIVAHACQVRVGIVARWSDATRLGWE